jgi:hypothetical protein
MSLAVCRCWMAFTAKYGKISNKSVVHNRRGLIRLSNFSRLLWASAGYPVITTAE